MRRPPMLPARWLLLAGLLLPLVVACGERFRDADEAERERIPEGPDIEAREGESIRGRLEYFYHRRAFPFDRIATGSLQRAQTQLASRWPAVVRGRAFLGAGAWSSLGPRPIASGPSAVSGRVTAVAVDPIDPNVIYVGGAQGGIWKSSDAGVSWSPRTDDQCSLAIGSIEIDPVNASIIYAGTGEANLSADSYYGCGILRSTDGGTTWAQFGAAVFDTPTGGAYIPAIVVDQASAGSAGTSVVIAATNSGVWRSTDSGQSWVKVQAGYATGLVQDPGTSTTWYAAITFTNITRGIYKSIDNGVNWAPATAGFPTTNIGRIALAIAPSAPNTLYAAIQDDFDQVGSDGALLGVYKTTDGALTWNQLTAGNASCSTQCWYDIVLAVNPLDPQQVIFGGIVLYESIDGGNNFTSVAGGIHVDQHALAFADATTLYAGNDGGVYRITIPGFSWESLNNDLALTQFYPGLSLQPGAGIGILGGTQDNGTLEYNGSPSWDFVLGADGGYTATDWLNAGVAYAETQWSANSGFSGPRRRDAFLGRFSLKTTGINLTEPANFIPPMVMDPVDPSVLYFGASALYRTSDRGERWDAISPAAGTAKVDAIGAGYDGLTVYYASSGPGSIQMQVTSNLGATWQPAVSGLPNRIVTDIQVDQGDPLTAYLVVSGFGTGHVFRTTNGGATWQNISGGLPDVPGNSILWIPSRGELYVGTDLGVFTSSDQGANWTPFVTGLPNVAVFDLVYNIASNTIVAGTHGRGAFAYTLPVTGVLRGDVSLDAQVTAVDAQAILSAAVNLPVPPGYVAAPNGDASCDSKVTAFDAQLVLSYAVGLPTTPYCVGFTR